MKVRNRIAVLALCLFGAAGAFAAQISGTVINGTTNKPSSGDEVALLSLATGMDEVAKTTTDKQGHYTLNVPDDSTQHLVRVTRQSVSYFKSAPPGTATADITVYDAATQLNSVATEARVLTLSASGGSLEVGDRYMLSNDSQPPRSRIGNQTFFVMLPEGATLTEASLTGPSGMPLAVNPVPSGAKDRYAFDFPIRPGKTRFEVFYKLPYSGQYEFSLVPDSPLTELGVLLPKSMKFTGTAPAFSQDADEEGLAVFFAKNVVANQPVKFSVSGEGVAPSGVPGANDTQPANNVITPLANTGGMSTKELQIAGGILFLILVGAFILWRMIASKKAGVDSKATKLVGEPRAPAQTQPAKPAPAGMLDVLKDELFQLETDRVNGKISQEDYEKTKAGLDALFRRQMNRK
ncbi:MAG TPA: hypothetical protein VFF39_14215 [Verrucomicrobiae bacterium]|nr:hypothetical protein [Verrucomicrobiae bacterium]